MTQSILPHHSCRCYKRTLDSSRNYPNDVCKLADLSLLCPSCLSFTHPFIQIWLTWCRHFLCLVQRLWGCQIQRYWQNFEDKDPSIHACRFGFGNTIMHLYVNNNTNITTSTLWHTSNKPFRSMNVSTKNTFRISSGASVYWLEYYYRGHQLVNRALI